MKDILGALLPPSGLCFSLAILGLVLCMIPRARRAAALVLGFAASLLVVFSSGKVATFLLSPLEYEYARVPDQAAPSRAIVVLAAYAADDRDMSLSDRPNSPSLYRIAEAALLWKRCRGCTVIVSGRSPTTDVMGEVLVALGVPRDKLIEDSDATNTADSAAHVRTLVGDGPFHLVTSAGHMPRSMAVFRAAGLRPVAAPTDHRLPRSVRDAKWGLSVFHLECSDLAIHERLGMWWYRWRGKA